LFAFQRHALRIKLLLPNSKNMPSIKRERFDGLKELEQDQPGFVKDPVELFVKTSQKKLIILGEAIACKDAKAIHLESHALKSSAANMGADTMAALCAKLEANGIAQDLSQSDADFSQLKKRIFLGRIRT